MGVGVALPRSISEAVGSSPVLADNMAGIGHHGVPVQRTCPSPHMRLPSHARPLMRAPPPPHHA